MILSIDQSLSCSGVIVWSNSGVQSSFHLIKTPPKGEVILRIREILQEIHRLVTFNDVTTIVIESLPFGINSSSVRPLAALYYCIQNYCIDNDILFYESNVTAVKKLATGSGKAKKEDMVQALLKQAPELHKEILKAGIKKTTGLTDLCDAYFIGKHFLQRKLEGESNDNKKDIQRRL